MDFTEMEGAVVWKGGAFKEEMARAQGFFMHVAQDLDIAVQHKAAC